MKSYRTLYMILIVCSFCLCFNDMLSAMGARPSPLDYNLLLITIDTTLHSYEGVSAECPDELLDSRDIEDVTGDNCMPHHLYRVSWPTGPPCLLRCLQQLFIMQVFEDWFELICRGRNIEAREYAIYFNP